jgi:signal transduction histidine kinase
LIKNSIDFVFKDKGKITITIERKENNQSNRNDYNSCLDSPNNLLSYYLFTVKDNGPGIPEEKIDLLFKKFNKIDTTASRRYGGTGLGLAICKDIVEMHGGKIWIDKSYRNGSSVKFTIPYKVS